MKRKPLAAILVPAGIITAGILTVWITRPGAVPQSTPSRPGAEAPDQRDTERYVDIVLNPGRTPIGMYWRDDSGRDIRSLQRLRDYLESRGERLRFAMNGGMYREDHSPAGLFIENGRVLSRLNTADGPGNFHMKPNGVFLVRNDGTASVVTTDRFANNGDITFATQSGPMLLIDGAPHPNFKIDSKNFNIRNGVGVRPDGAVIFSISREPVTFHDFAMHFKGMGCRDALYLDGFVSRVYLPERNVTELDGDFGVIIGVTE